MVVYTKPQDRRKKHVCLTRINIHNMGEASVKVRIGASCAEGTNSSLSQTMFSLSSQQLMSNWRESRV